jgi:competence protein ComGF
MVKKRFVVYLNDRAFTLIDTLFAFSIFIIIIFFISPVFQLMLNNRDIKGRLQVMEWEVFSSQIKKEIHGSQNAVVVGGNLVLSEDTETIVYEKYNNILRRRVNNSGHEVVLQNVSEVTFTLLNNAVRVSLKSLNGKEYSITIYSFLEWKTSA